MKCENPMCQKELWLALGIFGGMVAISIASIVIWNSKELRAARRARFAEKIMHRVGVALQGICEK